MTTQPDTAPHITRSTGYGGTSEADCRLCGAHASSHSLWAQEDIDAWAAGHATECTPASVRQRAAHLRDAAELIADHADHDPDDGTDWDQPAIQAAVDRLRARLQDTAQRLEAAADNAINPAPAAGSGSPAGAREDGAR